MNKKRKVRFKELVEMKIQSYGSQKQLAEKLGLTKYALSKVLHNKQKMYLEDYIDLSYELNMLNPRIQRPWIEEIFKEADDSIIENLFRTRTREGVSYEQIICQLEQRKIELENRCSELEFKLSHDLESTTKNMYLVNELFVDKEIFESNTYDDTIADRFLAFLDNIEKTLRENQSSFDANSYLEYLKLKKSSDLIENQYVFNLSELSGKTANE